MQGQIGVIKLINKILQTGTAPSFFSTRLKNDVYCRSFFLTFTTTSLSTDKVYTCSSLAIDLTLQDKSTNSGFLLANSNRILYLSIEGDSTNI